MSGLQLFFFALTMAYHIRHIGRSLWDVLRTVMIPIQRWPTSRSNLTWLRVWATASLCFGKVIPYLAHECITMERCVAYIHDLDLWSQYQNYFHHEFVSGLEKMSLLFDIDIQKAEEWVGVSVRQYVFSQHTNMLVGCILSEFYFRF